eukprot:GHUV01018562.1.p2 GENE.GHUV01018562.1~~GHUV01018562.1.p2  ORF type:complete len:150 (+),score=12.73 GHUV01018562.1:392-841(+)
MSVRRQLLAALLLAAGFGSCCSSRPAEKLGDVIILTDENFDAETACGVWMLDIYAPGCIYCQQLDPIWRSFASEMKKHDVKVAKIDGIQNRVIAKRFGIKGYPSIYLLRDGQTWQYNSVRALQEVSGLQPIGVAGCRLQVHGTKHVVPV